MSFVQNLRRINYNVDSRVGKTGQSHGCKQDTGASNEAIGNYTLANGEQFEG